MFIDGLIDQFFQAHPAHSPILVTAGGMLNQLGKGDSLAFICILLAVAGYFAGRSKWLKISWASILTVSASGIAVQTLKHLFGRARPQMNLGDLHFIGPNLHANNFDSFPSGHATSSFALASFLGAWFPKGRVYFYTTAACISLFGRVMNRHHFLTDVIGGAALGIAVGFLCVKLFSKWIERGDSPKPEPVRPLNPLKWNLTVQMVLVAAFSSAVFFPLLNASSLWDRDETEYAQAVIEMNRNNEWLIPTLEGETFTEKPILMYWFVKAGTLAFGENDFAFRLPSAIFGVLACLVTFLIANALWGNPAGFLAGMVLASSFLFVGVSQMLMTDPFLVLFSMLALLFYILSTKKRERLYLALSYVSIGFSFLAKGPFALFPVCVFVLYEWLSGKAVVKSVVKHALLTLIPVAIALPWFAHVFSKQTGAAENFLLYENLTRFLQSAEGHKGPMFYYIPVLLLGSLPWAPFLFSWIRREWTERGLSGKWDDGVLLLAVWAAFLFVFFSVTATKLPHYMLPVFPVLACFLGRFFAKGNWPKAPLKWTAGISLILALAPLSLFWIRPQFASWKLSVPFALLSISAWIAGRDDLWKGFSTLLIGTLLTFESIAFLTLPAIEQFKVMKPIALAIKRCAAPEARVVGYRISEPSLWVYSGRLFPKLESESLDEILKDPKPVYVVVTEKVLKENPVQTPTVVLERKEGFAENSGELTLLLISNDVKGWVLP